MIINNFGRFFSQLKTIHMISKTSSDLDLKTSQDLEMSPEIILSIFKYSGGIRLAKHTALQQDMRLQQCAAKASPMTAHVHMLSRH